MTIEEIIEENKNTEYDIAIEYINKEHEETAIYRSIKELEFQTSGLIKFKYGNYDVLVNQASVKCITIKHSNSNE